MNYAELGDKVKSKYPDYASVDSSELGKRVASKHPEYQAMITEEASSETQDLGYGRIAEKANQPLPVRDNPFVSGANAMKEAYKTPLNIEGLGARGMAGLQVLAAPYQAAESVMARQALAAQKDPRALLDPIQAVKSVYGGLTGPQQTAGDVNYRAGLTRGTADLAGGAQSFVLQAPEAIQGGINALNKIESGIPKLASSAKDAFGRFLKGEPSALSTSKGLSKAQRAQKVFETRANQIVQRGESTSQGILDALKNEVSATESQINNTKEITTQAKKAEIAKVQNDYGKKILDAEEQIASNEKAIPASAQRDSLAIKKEIPSWMGKQSERWNAEIDSALGGKEGDIFVNHNKVTDELKSLLVKRGVELDENGIASGFRGSVSPAEERIASIIKRLSGSDRAVSVRQLISDSNYLGKDIKYGKVFGSEQGLLDDAKSIIASQAEDIIPSIKDTKSWYSDYAQLRDRAFKSLDPFGGKYSTKATSFFEKLATGKAQPEDFQFLSDLEKSLGKSAGREASTLNSKNEMLKNFQEAMKSASKETVANIQKSLDAEIARLEDVLKQKQVKYETVGNTAKEIISQKSSSQASKYTTQANEARIRLANLNRMKTIAKNALLITAGTGGAVGVVKNTLLKHD